MKFFKRCTVLLYVTFMLFIACFFIMYPMHLPFLSFEAVSYNVGVLLYGLYSEQDLRLLTLALGVFLLISNLLFYRLYTVNIRRDKTIAFDNPSGRVSVSLIALEDLVKRLLADQQEIKEVRPKIEASKKGLHIFIRLNILPNVSIPEITSNLQDIVKGKIQEMIGLEGKLDVAIYVNKILPEPTIKDKKQKKDNPPQEEETNIPFQGYRA